MMRMNGRELVTVVTSLPLDRVPEPGATCWPELTRELASDRAYCELRITALALHSRVSGEYSELLEAIDSATIEDEGAKSIVQSMQRIPVGAFDQLVSSVPSELRHIAVRCASTPVELPFDAFSIADALHAHTLRSLHIRFLEDAQKVAPGERLELTRQYLESQERFSTSMERVRPYVPDEDNRPPVEPPLLTLNEIPLLGRGGIAMLVAAPGYGKSSVVEAVCSVAISASCDAFGLSTPSGIRTLLIDTERSRSHIWKAWDRVRRRAGVARPQDHGVLLTSYRPLDSVDALKRALHRDIRSWKPDLVILDLASDFLLDSELDAAEARSFVSMLSTYADRHDLGILLTLHPTSTSESSKLGGHLGSRLAKKCESVLLLKKSADGVRTLTTDFQHGKNRSGSDRISSSFRWSDELHMHVGCATPREASAGNDGRPAIGRDVFRVIFGEGIPLTRDELIAQLRDERERRKMSTSDGAIRKAITRAIETGILTEHSDGLYTTPSTPHF